MVSGDGEMAYLAALLLGLVFGVAFSFAFVVGYRFFSRKLRRRARVERARGAAHDRTWFRDSGSAVYEEFVNTKELIRSN